MFIAYFVEMCLLVYFFDEGNSLLGLLTPPKAMTDTNEMQEQALEEVINLELVHSLIIE
jgi:hypothetical protein